MFIYHKISVEVTAPDGRCWTVEIEPPLSYEEERPHLVSWDCKITRYLLEEERQQGILPGEPLTYKIPSGDGMYAALGMAMSLIPDRQAA